MWLLVNTEVKIPLFWLKVYRLLRDSLDLTRLVTITPVFISPSTIIPDFLTIRINTALSS